MFNRLMEETDIGWNYQSDIKIGKVIMNAPPSIRNLSPDFAILIDGKLKLYEVAVTESNVMKVCQIKKAKYSIIAMVLSMIEVELHVSVISIKDLNSSINEIAEVGELAEFFEELAQFHEEVSGLPNYQLVRSDSTYTGEITPVTHVFSAIGRGYKLYITPFLSSRGPACREYRTLLEEVLTLGDHLEPP